MALAGLTEWRIKMKKLSEIKKEEEIKKSQKTARSRKNLVKMNNEKLSNLNSRSIQARQIHLINFRELSENLDRAELMLNVSFGLSAELIDSIMNLIINSTPYGQAECKNPVPACTILDKFMK